MSDHEKYIVLFDEYGTPTFDENSESDIFAGLAILYEAMKEEIIFESFDEILRFSTKKSPIKTRDIQSDRAIAIANTICKQNFFIVFNYLDLRNPDYQAAIRDYELLGNFARKTVRNVRERKISQILYSRVLNNCLFKVITNHHSEKHVGKIQYEVYIDNWSFPMADKDLILKDGAESIQRNIQDILYQFSNDVEVSVSEIKLMVDDDARKRLIDAFVSVISRNFFPEEHPRRDPKPFKLVSKCLVKKFECDDITDEEIELIKKFTLEFASKQF